MNDRLELVRPGAHDWRQFLMTSQGEGWRVPAIEMALFRGPLADSVIALRCEERFVGLVSAVNHGASAWVGNLIVRPEWRGRGYGQRLLDRAILSLSAQGPRSIWLTASETGYPLYRRRGFETIGRVDRWVFTRGSVPGGVRWPTAEYHTDGSEALLAVDAAVWGEKRSLLEWLLPKARVLRFDGSLALLQREPGLRILGPWFNGAAGGKGRSRLLDAAVAAVRSDEELVVDVRAGSLLPQILEDAGFVLQGTTRLMARGEVAGIDLKILLSFASLGSMG